MDKAFFFSRRSLAVTCVFAFLINLLVFGSTPAFADVFTVNLTTDQVDADPGDGRCDIDGDLNEEDCTLRAAVMEANRLEGPDTIDVAVSDVTLSQPESADDTEDDDEDDLDLTDTARTTINGNGVDIVQTVTDRIFEVEPEAAAELNSMSVSGGRSGGDGGGIDNAGFLTLAGVFIFGNHSGDDGGGLKNDGEGLLTATAIAIHGNSAVDTGGAFNNTAFARLSDSEIGEEANPNTAENRGGGIYNAGRLAITNTAVSFNEAADGGGIYNTGDGDPSFGGCCPPEMFAPEEALLASEVIVEDNVATGTAFEVGTVSHEPGSEPHGPGEGGGIWNDGWLLMELSDIFDNLAVSGNAGENIGGEGGGIYNAGGFTQTGASVSTQEVEDECFAQLITSELMDAGGGGACIVQSTVLGNVAQGEPPEFADIGDESSEAGKGGGIWNGTHFGGEDPETGLMFVESSEVLGNQGALGGGFYNHDGGLIVSESAVSNNFAADPVIGTAGGGAYLSGRTEGGPFFDIFFQPCTTSVCFFETTFEGNDAFAGGGVYIGTNFSVPEIDVLHSTLNDNDATQGGGIWNDSHLRLLNSTLSSNNASQFGGGLHNECCQGVVSSTANTFHRNVAGDDGGNVYDNTLDTTEFRMTILSDGTPNNCNTEEGFPNFDDEGFNLDTDDTCDMEEGTGSIVDESAQLASLNENDGPTETHALRRGSPALDAVALFACPPPEVDQRGFDRPEDGTDDDNEEDPDEECDIGSFEHQEGESFPSSGGGSSTDECEDGDDNDNDGKVDLNDPGCVDANDDSEDTEGTPSPGPTPTTSPTPGPGPGPGPGGEARFCVDFAEQFGLNLVEGTNGDDVLRGTDRGDVICAKDGNDEVYGRGGGDIIWLGEGDDYVVAGAGNDVVRGGPGVDQAEGKRGNDEMTLGRGDDLGQGGAGDDSIYGREQADNLTGGAGDDRLFGGPGKDTCSGGPGVDTKNSC